MASFKEDVTEMNNLDDDISGIIGEYSIPNLAEITSESLLTKSQYAKVIFHDLLPCYPTDADIWCRYTLTDDIKSRHGDRIALYRVGWVSVHDHVQFEMAPVTNSSEEKEFRVLFKAEVLPKDITEFYQLCYVSVNDAVCGASVPFQFRHPVEGELCEVEEQGGLLVVRSTTAISEEKLRDAARMIRELKSEKLAREEKIQALECTKDSLSLKVEELSSIQKREAQLRQGLEVLEKEKAEAMENWKQADKQIQALNVKVQSLNRDNCALNEMLKSESQKVMTEEISRYKVQIDNMQQMLDALVDSKELASQALQCEQSKVMTLNIEHDKYKFRSQQLEEENKGLRMELKQKRSVIETLEIRLKQNEALLETKFKDSDITLSKLQQVIKQIGQLQFELNKVNERNDCLQLQLKQRDNQIIMLDSELKDLLQKDTSFEQLAEEYTNLKRKLKEYDGVWTNMKTLKDENKMLRNKMDDLQITVSGLLQCRDERNRLASEFELLSVSHVALQNELYANLNKSSVNARSCLSPVAEEGSCSQSGLSINELKSMLSAAEANNASLMNELKQIRDMQPDWKVHNQTNGNHLPSKTDEDCCVRCSTMSRAPVRSSELKSLHQSLKEEREKLEAELEDVTTKANDFMVRCESKSKRLVAIAEDVVNAKNDLELAVMKNRQAKEDLVHLNNRMVTIQQQILHDDQKDGRDFYESGDQERLERMSKRCHDLQCMCTESASEIHDLKQNIQVLDQERIHIEEELKNKPSLEKKLTEEKCKVLEKLVNLDQKLLMLRGDNFPVEETVRTNQNITEERLENSQSHELHSTHLESSDETATPQAVEVSVLDKESEDKLSVSEVSTAGATVSSDTIDVESFQKAVEMGVYEGINTLKQEAYEQLNPTSSTFSSESLLSIEQKCALVNEECREQEQKLQENLAAALKNTIRKELMSGAENSTETSSNVGSDKNDVEAHLKLRLDLAAEEYKKLYIQKLKFEKQLIRLQERKYNPVTQAAPVDLPAQELKGFVCPFCGACFPSSNRDSFTRHYEDHLF